MAVIKGIKAREIIDSRANPTVESSVFLSDGTVATAACPAGASIGAHEAAELRDHDVNRYQGLGVMQAVKNIEDIIAPALLEKEVTKQQEIDKTMIQLDGTENKAKLGANAILSVSMAVAKAGAASSPMPLYTYLRQFLTSDNSAFKIPTPVFNIINGGKHADNNVNFQEFIIIPASSKPFSESLQLGTSVYHTLKNVLKTKGLSTLVGDEGGFAPHLGSAKEGFSFIGDAIAQAGYKMGLDIFLGLDAAASNFYKNKKYHLNEWPTPLTYNELSSMYQALSKEFPLLYLEDPLFEDEWDGWTYITSLVGGNTIIVGDDLTVTNPFRLQQAITAKAITGILIKPNQIGTVIETIAVVEIAKSFGLKIIVSHRSGETNDDFIADFAVAAGADYAKFGAPARGERVAKYNRLLQIEQQLKTITGS